MLIRSCSCDNAAYRQTDIEGGSRVNDWNITYNLTYRSSGGPWASGDVQSGFYGSHVRWNIPARTTYYWAGYVNCQRVDGSDYIFWNFYGSASGSNKICEIRFTLDDIEVYEQDTTLNDTGNTVSMDNSSAYTFVEMKIVFHPTTGSVQIRFNGSVVYTFSNLDTCGAYTSGPLSVTFGSSSVNAYFDDFAVYDTNDDPNDTGGGHSLTDYTGPWRMTIHMPTGDTAQKDWTPDSGTTNYTQIDDPDLDTTTYIESTVVGDRDEYALADGPDYPIVSAFVIAAGCNPDAGGANLTVGLESSGVETSSSAAQPSGTVYSRYTTHAADVDPNTGVEWTESGFNAALLVLENGP